MRKLFRNVWIKYINNMNKENKARYTKLFIDDKLTRYTSFIGREYAIPPPNLKEAGANDLTRLVIDFLNMSNCQAERISSQGQYRDGKKQVTDVIGRVRTIGSGVWTPGTNTKGTADISATIKEVTESNSSLTIPNLKHSVLNGSFSNISKCNSASR